MPAAKTVPAAKKKSPASRSTDGRAGRSTVALDGLEISLEEAQKALVELRRDLSTGGRALVKDVDAAVTKARRDLRRTRKALQRDLESFGTAMTPRRAKAPSAKAPRKATRRA